MTVKSQQQSVKDGVSPSDGNQESKADNLKTKGDTG